MLSRMLLRTWLLVALLASASAQGFAQRDRKPEMAPFAAQGTVQAVMPGRIQIQTVTNQAWMVFVDPAAQIHVTGTAEADFLKRGMFIRFSAQLDKRGKSRSPIAELTIFTPYEESPVGIWPQGALPAAGAEGADQAGGGFGPGANTGAGTGAAKTPATSFYMVAGQITGQRKGKLTVNAGRAIVQIELIDEPTINVDFADYTVAQKGNKISVTKGKMFRGRMGVAQAQELSIVLAEPLTGSRKKPTRPKTPPRSTRKPEKPQPPEKPEQPEKPSEREKPSQPAEKKPKAATLEFDPDGKP